MAGAVLTPRVRIMAICDGVRESRTEAGVFHLKGVRQQLVSNAYPFVPKRLWLFFLLSSVRAGEFICYVRMVHDRTDRTLFYAYVEPRPRFDLDGGLLAIRVPMQCAFPEAGQYTVQVWFFQKEGSDVLKGELPFRIAAGGHGS